MGNFLPSQFAAKGVNPRTILCRVLGYLTGYGVLGWAVMAGATFVMRLLTPKVEFDLALMTTFGATVLLYAVSIGFNKYWASIGRARMVFYGQVAWALSIVATTFFRVDQCGALALAAGLVIVSLAQLLMHLAHFSIQVSR